MMILFNDFAYSEQGYNHIKVDKECQDASGSYSDDTMSICVVADGHGSDNYPRTALGSGFAVEVTIDAIKEFVKTLNESNEDFDLFDAKDIQLKGLVKNILMRWHEMVNYDVYQNPFTNKDLVKVAEKYKTKFLSGESIAKAYGTTLIATCITPNYWFGVHIGDGKCVAIDEKGTCYEPIPWDDECQANITTSICDSDAFDEFRYYKSDKLPLAVFLGCDGVDDSYSSDDELHNFYRSILYIFGEHGLDVVKNEVRQFLPQLSKKGSGDDVSIAGLVKSDISELTVKLIKAQVEYDNALLAFEIIKKEFRVAEEKVDYVNESLKKARKSLSDIEEKQLNVQVAYERKGAEKAAAEKRLAEAKALLNAIKDEMNQPISVQSVEQQDCQSEDGQPNTEFTEDFKKVDIETIEKIVIIETSNMPDEEFN